MAKIITKFRYSKPTADRKIGGYAGYIATREGVEKIDDSKKYAPVTKKQREIIRKILKDFPDSKEMFEYEDYQKNQTVGSASEFIMRAVEDNAVKITGREGYAKYIAMRPNAEKTGTHGLFTDDGVVVNLPDVMKEINRHNGNIWTVIVSLRREDAQRLGFDTGQRWRDMLRTQGHKPPNFPKTLKSR